MKVRTDRNKDYEKVDRLEISIGDKRYLLRVDNEEKLVVNKTSDSGDENISINPAYANQIKIS